MNFDAVPNLNPSSYVAFATYNGTLGYSNRMFSTVVSQDSGTFSSNNVPILTYNPNGVSSVTDAATLQDVVIEISMFNGTIDVLNYSEGYLNVGNKDYVVESRRAFPTVVSNMPNVEYKQVYLDGWYSYTFVLFRDSVPGNPVFKDNYYSRGGFIFKASVDGLFGEDSLGSGIHITNADPAGTEFKEYQVENNDYESILFWISGYTGESGQANHTYLHSQALVTDTLRDAIVAEAIDIACDSTTGIEFMDWQKLSAKRIGAYVFFENGIFEKAQVIMESARTMCLNKKVDLARNC